MSEREILRAAFKTAYLNKDHRFQPDMRRYGELGEYKDSTLENEFETFCDGVKYAIAAQRDEGLAREAELQKSLEDKATLVDFYQNGALSTSIKNAGLQQRLAEAKRLLLDVRGQLCGPDQRAIDAFLARYGCADGEEAE